MFFVKKSKHVKHGGFPTIRSLASLAAGGGWCYGRAFLCLGFEAVGCYGWIPIGYREEEIPASGEYESAFKTFV